jgi:MoaA/NifB/PqqE/SkfB family radical SAM enzyme
MRYKAQVIPRIFQYKLFRAVNHPIILPLSVTVSVTYRCNSRCKTCNVWKKKTNEFSLDEFDETFKSLKDAPFMFVMSGGEPILREDIVEICQSAYNRCKPGIITIPTNGILYDRIPKKVSEIAESCPRSQVVINLSIDGIENDHDEIRGIKGNFEKAMQTYEGLMSLEYPNLEIGVHSVISQFNVNEIPNIYKYFQRLSGINSFSYITEIAEERVELDNVGKGITPSPRDYAKVVNFLSDELQKEQFSGISKITQGFRLEYYKLVKRILAEKRQVIPCYAGFASAQIAPDGDVWQCCIKAEPIGNLRDTDYDFMAIWKSEKAKLARECVRRGECYCPMANASYTNMLCNLKTSLKVGAKVVL